MRGKIDTETDIYCDISKNDNYIDVVDEFSFYGEGISELDVKNILKLFSHSVDFGLALLHPNLPFAVQYYVLQLIKNKKLSCIFTSHSMSMGINYPLRSTIISSPSGISNYPLSLLLQMAGRCGRRGFDTIGHIILSGISNLSSLSSLSLSNLSTLSFPLPSSNGPLVSNTKSLLASLFSVYLHHDWLPLFINSLFSHMNLFPSLKFYSPLSISSIISNLSKNIILDSYTSDSMTIYTILHLLKLTLQELQIKYHKTLLSDLLSVIQHLFHLIHKCQIKLIRLH
jgi:replicative superfamily II helicase